VNPRAVKAIRWTLVAVWAAVIFGMSSIPGSNVPGRFGPLAHFIEYTVLGGLVFYALSPDVRPSRAAWVALALSSAYAISDEFHQSFVPMRTPDPVDWLVDTAGATLAVSIGWLLASRRRPQ